eukprot:GGOE01020151.1.p1 GENE.GGOE01020151.1~~GGOE01020151.1.p1  ORF type:complete len:225 (+),score=22.48 GGOE01020151.1:394-1068(+)
MQHARRFTLVVRAASQVTKLSYLYPWPGKGFIKHDRHWSKQAFSDPDFISHLRDLWKGEWVPCHLVASFGLHEKAMNRTRYEEGVRALMEFHSTEASKSGTRLVWRELFPTSDEALLELGGSDSSLEDMNQRANRIVESYAKKSSLVGLASIFHMAWSLYRDAHEISDGVHYGAKRIGKGKADSGWAQRCTGLAARLPCGRTYRGHVSRMASQVVLGAICSGAP